VWLFVNIDDISPNESLSPLLSGFAGNRYVKAMSFGNTAWQAGQAAGTTGKSKKHE